MSAERQDADAEAVLTEHALVQESRERQRNGASASAYLVGGGYAAAVSCLLLPGVPHVDWASLALLVAAYAVVWRVRFEFGPGSALLGQLVFVPMLLLLPLRAVPLAVGLGILAGGVFDRRVCDCRTRERPFALLGGGWHTLGPVVVLLAAGDPSPRLARWPLYLAALGAQFAFDAAYALVRTWLGLRFPLRRLVVALGWVFLVDAALSPAALAAALAADGSATTTIVIVAPLVLFIAIFARERRAHLARATRLAAAYSEAATRARLDPLTGLANRLAWDEALATCAPDAHAAFLVLDVNGLKRANDLHGHAVGDALLVVVASLLRDTAHQAAIVARLGGDEFGAVFIGAAAGRAATAATSLRARFAGHDGVNGIPVAAGIGTAACPPLSDLVTALAEADRRAYSDKREAPHHRRPDAA